MGHFQSSPTAARPGGLVRGADAGDAARARGGCGRAETGTGVALQAAARAGARP